MCMRTSCPTSSPVAGAPVPELLGALLKVADPGRILSRDGGRNVGQQNKGVPGVSTSGGLNPLYQSVPALDATGAQTPISEPPPSARKEPTAARAEVSRVRADVRVAPRRGAVWHLRV